MRKNYKKAFDILLRNVELWKDATDKTKKQIFYELNQETGFNYCLKDCNYYYKFRGWNNARINKPNQWKTKRTFKLRNSIHTEERNRKAKSSKD